LRGLRVSHRFVCNGLATRQFDPFPAIRRIQTAITERCNDGSRSFFRHLHPERGVFFGAVKQIDLQNIPVVRTAPLLFDAFVNVEEHCNQVFS